MKIVVCAKEVLDPDAVNNYALAGGLQIGADGKTAQSAIPRLMNAYDGKRSKTLRLRDGGVAAKLAVVSAGTDPASILPGGGSRRRRDQLHVQVDPAALDLTAVAKLLAAYVTKTGGADLILCGRQASDDDQGVDVAQRAARHAGRHRRACHRHERRQGRARDPRDSRRRRGRRGRPTLHRHHLERARHAALPTAQTIKARKMKPAAFTPETLGLGAGELAPRVVLTNSCPRSGASASSCRGSPAELAQALLARLRADGAIA
ncbi:MAG: hypothetical protein U0610_07385 [bacterium]